MSNTTSLEDLAMNEEMETIPNPQEEMEVPVSSPGVGEIVGQIIEKLKTPTGDGDISDYEQHVFNPKGSRGMAQMLRGITGIFGSLNFAIVDIILGFTQLQSEKGKSNVHHGVGSSVSQGGHLG